MTPNRNFNIVAGLLALALAVGGAGLAFPLIEMALELCAISVLAYFAFRAPAEWRFNRFSALALGLVALTVLLPLCQLVPLPPQLWHRLPGRQLPVELDTVLGWARWRPLTLDVEGTLRSSLRLLAPTAIFIGCLFLPATKRARLFLVIVGFALLGGCLGIVQFVSGGWLTPYPSGHLGYPIGFFVNRNHNAAFLLASMPCIGALAAIEIGRGRPAMSVILAALSALAVLVAVVLGTTSRMGLALLPVGIGAFTFILFRRDAPFKMVLPSVIGIAALLLYLFISGGFARTLSRFSSADDNRFSYWADASWALHHYRLAGTGVGTFVPVFQSAESLASISPAIVNHAHNDYLELILDGGWAAGALFVLFLCLLGAALYRGSTSQQGAERALVRTAAVAGGAILLLSSLVDYPLRMPAMSSTFAVLCATLLPTKRDAARRPIGSTTRAGWQSRSAGYWLKRSCYGVVLIIVATVVVQAGISARAILDGRYDTAVRWAPWSTRAYELRSTEALLHNRGPEAFGDATSALRLSPIDARAIRTAGLVRIGEGQTDQGNRLMLIAATLGWRDPLTQLWSIQAAEQTGEPRKALERAEALFREQALVEPAIAELLRAPAQERMPSLLASTLQERPDWRRTFFEHTAAARTDDFRPIEQVIVALNDTKAPVGMTEAQPLLEGLIDAGNSLEAQRVWGLLHRGGLLSNADFEQFGTNGGTKLPSYWKIDSNDLGRVGVVSRESPAGNHALRLLASRGLPILAQQLMLEPGRYDFRYDVRVSPGPAALLQWELRCLQSHERQEFRIVAPQGVGWSESRFTLTVPERDCLIQRLALMRSRATTEQQVWLDNLNLESTAR